MHVSDDDIHLYLQGKLGRLRVGMVEIHVAGCAWCQARIGQTWNLITAENGPHGSNPLWRGSERRHELRVRTNDLAVLQVVTPFSEEHLNARVTNVSNSGLQISLGVALEPGSVVKVKRGATVFFGQVRYCRGDAAKFSAGLHLQESVSLASIRHIEQGATDP